MIVIRRELPRLADIDEMSPEVSIPGKPAIDSGRKPATHSV